MSAWRALQRIAALLVLALTATPADAHELRPAYLELRELGQGRYDVLWKVPARGDLRLRLDVVFAEDVEVASPQVAGIIGEAHFTRWRIRREGGLAGTLISVPGLSATLTDALVRIERRDGSQLTHRLTPARPTWLVAGSTSWWDLARTYTAIGVEHILLGFDHLLFVLGLLCIVRGGAALLRTVTAFTLAHSVTLALATLGVAHAPVEPLNAAIALSILFLGPEIVRARRGGTSLTLRHPGIVAFLFGLLHGFGFSSGLTTLGLSRGEVVHGLLWFNVGVELGQLGFVALILAMVRSFRAIELRWPDPVARTPELLIGVCGAYWTLERTALLL